MKAKLNPIIKRVDKITTQNPDRTKPYSKFLEEYKDCYKNETRILTEAFLERFSIEMVNWAKDNQDALFIGEFSRSKGISPARVLDWCSKFPIMKKAYDETLSLICENREKGALTRKYDSGSVFKVHGMYSPEYKEFLKWQSMQKDQQSSGSITINLPDITSKKDE